MATPRQKKTGRERGERPRRHGAGILIQEGKYAGKGVPATPGRQLRERTASGCAGDSHTCQPLRSGISKTINFMLEGAQTLQHFGINAVQTI